MWRISNASFTTTNFAGYFDFKLQQLPNHTEFVNLFDVYKIWKVEVTFIPKYNSSDFSSGGLAYGLPTLYVAEDRNDVSLPATVNELMEYAVCRAQRFDKPMTYTCWPTLSAVIPGGGSVIDMSQKDLWVRCSNPDAPYNGIRYACDLPIGLETFRYDIVLKYFLKFKDVK